MELIRLQKIIADRGYCSRRKADELIQSGVVEVDGEIVTELGTKYSPDVKIRINGETIKPRGNTKYTYLLLNKPSGYITTSSDDRGRKKVIDLIPRSFGRLFPVGRLDLDTHGAIIMTDDGEFANLVMHPSSSLNKTYWATIRGKLTEDDVRQLQEGILLQDGYTAPAQAKELVVYDNGDSLVQLIIHEGKKREVRRMLEYLDHKVVDLQRKAIAHLRIDGVPLGRFIPIDIKDVEKIKALCYANKKSNSFKKPF